MPPQHLAPKRPARRQRRPPAHLAVPAPAPPGTARRRVVSVACAAVPLAVVGVADPVGATTAATAARPSSYVVRRGDTLGGIAGRFGLTATALAAANRRPVHATLLIGTRLVVPPAAAPAVTTRSPAPTAPALPAALRADQARLAMAPVLRRAAKAQGAPTDLLMALCWQESGWQPRITSSAGAVGLCQVLPVTADHIGRTVLHRRVDPARPQDNADVAAAYLAQLLRRYRGETASALTAYFAGPARADVGYWTPATARYVGNVSALRPAFATLR